MVNSANFTGAQIARNITDIVKKPTLFLSYSQKDSTIANIIESQLKYETNECIEISRYTKGHYNKDREEVNIKKGGYTT